MPASSPGLGDFTPQAPAYASARPGYPPALVDRLLASAGVAPGDAVTDLGAGTGLFTALLSGRHLRVTAIEPAAAMRGQAPALPGVTWREGTFEATGLPDGSQAWAASAQAFHWADPARAPPEVARILAPGRCFTILWNDRQVEREPLLAWVRDAIRRLMPEHDEHYRKHDWPAVLTSTGHFADVRTDQEEHRVTMSAARFVTLWRSLNRLAVVGGAQRLDALIQELEEHLRVSGIERVEVPYVCRAWTARRA